MNKVIITGNTCKDNDVRMTNDNKKVIRNSVAVRRNYKNQQGNYDSDFINIVCYEPQSKFMDQYISKGDKVGIVGKWQHRTYQASDGTNRQVDECVIESIELLGKPQAKAQHPVQQQADTRPAPTQNEVDYGLDIDAADLPF